MLDVKVACDVAFLLVLNCNSEGVDIIHLKIVAHFYYPIDLFFSPEAGAGPAFFGHP